MNWPQRYNFILQHIRRTFRLGFSRHPSYVNIETSSECNRKCWYCPNATHPRPRSYMSIPDIRSILIALQADEYRGIIRLWGFNEPLMDERIVSIVRMVRFHLPGREIQIYSNGDFADGSMVCSLEQAGLSELLITDHDAPPGEWRRKIGGMELIVRSRPPYLANRAGAVGLGGRRPWVCMQQDEINIDVNGNVRFCANDYWCQENIGNALKTNLLYLWNRDRWRRLLPAFGIMTGVCRGCRMGRFA